MTPMERLQCEVTAERYLRQQIEQRCDPAGETRQRVLTQDENRHLQATLAEVEETLAELDNLHQPVECECGVPTCEPICSCGQGHPCREHLIIHGKVVKP